LSLRRNEVLEGMAALLRSDAQRSAALAAGTPDPALERLLDEFLEDFSPAGESVTNLRARRAGLGRLLLEIAACPPRPPREAPTAGRRDRFVAAFPEEERAFAEALLDLARASYRLRDDDNLHLDRVRRETERAVAEGRQRLELRTGKSLARLDADAVAAALGDPAAPMPESAPDGSAPAAPSASAGRRLRIQPRQIVGQPAGPGLAAGPARVVAAPEDLFTFQSGEILVCDAIDPGMTFVVPLAAAVVERRGGMLIHGAIIAREYGLPCVTGVPDATRVIRTGARITVDGYLGIVYLPADAG
jgi:pyruvate,water dikinase